MPSFPPLVAQLVDLEVLNKLMQRSKAEGETPPLALN